MRVEILSTGDELTSGAVIDSNSGYIARKIEERGYSVSRHTCVADNLGDLSYLIGEIAQRADLALVTGGLGPTADDITANAAAAAAGSELSFNKEAKENVEHFFKKRSLPYNDLNDKQAMLPEGAVPIFNPVGTAPGFYLTIKGCTFIFLPGVPHEMKAMMEKGVPEVVEGLLAGEKRVNLTVTISTFGLPESVVGGKVASVEEHFPPIRLGMRAKFPEIQIKLYAAGTREEGLSRELSRASAWVVEQFGSKVFSTEGLSMEAEVGRLLTGRGATLAAAESCTGGLIGHMATDVPGSSDFFLFSGVTYSNEAKINILGVNKATIVKHGAVHENTAMEMAEGARRVSGATYAISTTGIAGPDGGTAEKPVGTVCIGIAGPGFARAKKFRFKTFDRLLNKRIFAVTALDMLRRELLSS